MAPLLSLGHGANSTDGFNEHSLEFSMSVWPAVHAVLHTAKFLGQLRWADAELAPASLTETPSRCAASHA